MSEGRMCRQKLKNLAQEEEKKGRESFRRQSEEEAMGRCEKWAMEGEHRESLWVTSGLDGCCMWGGDVVLQGSSLQFYFRLLIICPPGLLMFCLCFPPPRPLPHMSPTSNSSPLFASFFSQAHPSVSSSKTAIIHQRLVFSFSSLIHFPPPSLSPTAALLGEEHLTLNHHSLRSSSNRRPDRRAEEWSSTLNLSW